MTEPAPAAPRVEHCLKALALVYNRLGVPGSQGNEDFDLLVDGESRIELIDLLMTVAGVAALILEEIVPLYDSLELDGIADDDPLIQARAVLDAIRDMLVDQGINETA